MAFDVDDHELINIKQDGILFTVFPPSKEKLKQEGIQTAI